MLRAVLFTAALAFTEQAAAAAPIPLKMALGSDSITVKGVLSQHSDCCVYSFKAAAGQQLYVTETGAVARLVISYPNGESDGPGFESPKTLPADGAYTLSISPNLMAEGGFGRFTLTIRIPPKR